MAISFENEVLIMKSVIHPNLIRLEEVFETKKVIQNSSHNKRSNELFLFISPCVEKKLYLITELCEAGELSKWIKKQGPIPEHISKLIMRQIVDAISYLHKNGKLPLHSP